MLFFESFFLMCLFLRPSIYFFSSPPIIFPPQLNFPPVEIIRRRRSFGFNSGKIRWDSACIRRNECSFVLCARFWVDVCVWRREKETAKARSAIFPVNFKRLFWGGGVPPPLNHQLITKETNNNERSHFFLHPPTTGRRSPNPRGFSHGPPTRVRDGWRSHRTSVRRDEILRPIRHGFAAIRHRVFAHFIWYFYHFELHSV